jgi:hypothetical protein
VLVARIVSGGFRLAEEAGCEVFGDGGAAAGGIEDWLGGGGEAPLGAAAGAAAAGAGVGGLEAGVAIAFTALRQGADNFPSLRRRHSRASLPPGRTLAQLAMKSERQEARTASRCAWVGCCAATDVSVSASTNPATSEDRNIEPFLGISGIESMPVIVSEVQQRRDFLLASCRSLFAAAVRSAT